MLSLQKLQSGMNNILYFKCNFNMDFVLFFNKGYLRGFYSSVFVSTFQFGEEGGGLAEFQKKVTQEPIIRI